MFSVQNRTVRYRELNPKKGRNFFVSHPKYDLKITIESREGDKDLGGGEGEGDDGSGSLTGNIRTGYIYILCSIRTGYISKGYI